MPITLVTTAGAASANAYVTEAEADGYAQELLPEPLAWATAAQDLRRRAIVAATRRLDQETFRGDRVNETQALAWPRLGAPTAAGTTTESTTAIPERVKRGTALLAFWLVAHAAEDPLAVTTDAGFTSMSFGGEFSASFDAEQAALPPVEQVMVQVVRPALGALVLGPTVRVVRG